jgi:hypothetical protein
MAMLTGLVLAGGCATTQMTDTWVDPAARGAGLKKVAVIALAKDPGLRRMAEDEVAKQSRETQLVPSYKVLEATDLQNREAVKTRLRAAGFDGVLVMKMAGVSEKLVPVPGGPYDRFDAYYDWAYGSAYGGWYETETTVRVISSLYALDRDKLIWSGMSKTFDPTSARQMVDDVSHEVAKSLQKERLVL